MRCYEQTKSIQCLLMSYLMKSPGHQQARYWYWKIGMSLLIHWGRVMHIYVNDLPIIGSDNGLSPGQHQSIIWTNAGILLIGPSETNFSEIWIEIHTFSFKKMHLKMSSAKWCLFNLSPNMLNTWKINLCHFRMRAIQNKVFHDDRNKFWTRCPIANYLMAKSINH